MLRYLPSSTQKTHSSQFLLFPPTHKARFSSWFEFFTSPSVTEQHPGPQITAKPGIFTVHLHQQLRLDSATGLVLVRRASAAADGIYFIYEDCCRSVKPRLDSNESTAVKIEAASTGPQLTTTQFRQKYHGDDFPVCHKKTIQNLWFTNCLSFYTSNCASQVRGLSVLVGFPQKPALKRGKGTQALFRQVFFNV